MNEPSLPSTYSIAFRGSILPAPCVNGSYLRSLAVDISIALTSDGSYSIPLSLSTCISKAAEPDAIGAAMLVPPNTPNACVEFTAYFEFTGKGVNP